jgi:hypothetical protein
MSCHSIRRAALVSPTPRLFRTHSYAAAVTFMPLAAVSSPRRYDFELRRYDPQRRSGALARSESRGWLRAGA